MADILAVGRALAEAYNTEQGGGFVNTGRKNAYSCEECGAYCITIDRHPGVTPFGIKCDGCGGHKAYSKGYHVQQHLEPTHEWYRPDTLDGIDPRYFEHLEKGGLILRPIDDARWIVPDDILKSPQDSTAQLNALKVALQKAEKECRAEVLTRQQRRHLERKGSDAPAEIQMYGCTYRRIDQ